MLADDSRPARSIGILDKLCHTTGYDPPGPWLFAGVQSDEARLWAAINGVDGVVSKASETLEKFSGWLRGGALIIRFEDIVGSRGGGCDLKQRQAVRDIADFIEVKLDSYQAAHICNGIFNPSTLTFRMPQVNGWRAVFSSAQTAASMASCGHLMSLYGYQD